MIESCSIEDMHDDSAVWPEERELGTYEEVRGEGLAEERNVCTGEERAAEKGEEETGEERSDEAGEEKTETEKISETEPMETESTEGHTEKEDRMKADFLSLRKNWSVTEGWKNISARLSQGRSRQSLW